MTFNVPTNEYEALRIFLSTHSIHLPSSPSGRFTYESSAGPIVIHYHYSPPLLTLTIESKPFFLTQTFVESNLRQFILDFLNSPPSSPPHPHSTPL